MIGVDTASISRIAKALCNPAFKANVFTPRECEYCDGRPAPTQSYAGIFCAKEAAAKALNTGFGKGVMPSDIEIDHAENGAPILVAHGGAATMLASRRACVSISHDGDFAVAVVQLSDTNEAI